MVDSSCGKGRPGTTFSELMPVKKQLYMVVLTTLITYTIPKAIDLLSHLTLYVLQLLFH